MKKIAVIGLGYVGLPLAVEFGRIRDVIGYDINVARISELASGFDVTHECTKEEILGSKYLQFSDDMTCLAEAEIYIITVPTPIDGAKRPDLKPLRDASETVGRLLKTGDIVIYESTVFPGATEEVCVPILESASELKFNRDFFCGYSPERINPGDKVNTLTRFEKLQVAALLK